MKAKIHTLKFKVTDDEKIKIDAAVKKAGYETRSAYLRDSALLETPADLAQIASHIGRLGMLCNDLLLDDEHGRRKLDEKYDAKKAARKIVKACDAIIEDLRKDD
jgi:hypothetical protein